MHADSDGIRDVIIIGGGPAGLAAALYAARDRYDTLILEKNGLPGGQIMLTEAVENYPGWLSIAGPELIEQQRKQAENFGAEIVVNQAVTRLGRQDDGTLCVETNNGETAHRARAVILSPGSDYRKLGVPGEDALRQMGKVSYCGTCDGAFYRDKEILTVGGGNTAVEDTVYLAQRFARKTTIIHRRLEFRAQKVLVEDLHETAKDKDLHIKLPYVLEEIVPTADGAEIDHCRLRNVDTGDIEQITVDGVFIFVGMAPNTQWLRGSVAIDENGYIQADPVTMRTNVPGVFVAGDCRTRAAMQLATATADGVVAAMQLKEYYRNPEAWAVEGLPEGRTEGW